VGQSDCPRPLTFLGNLHGGLDWVWVDDLAQRLDLDLSRRVGTFSHGNKQKVGLIQAFCPQTQLADPGRADNRA